jgi:hypothetical protein
MSPAKAEAIMKAASAIFRAAHRFACIAVLFFAFASHAVAHGPVSAFEGLNGETVSVPDRTDDGTLQHSAAACACHSPMLVRLAPIGGRALLLSAAAYAAAVDAPFLPSSVPTSDPPPRV